MEATIQKAKQNVRRYLELKGYEILKDVWCHDGDSVDFIATEFSYESSRTAFSRRPIPIVSLLAALFLSRCSRIAL